MEFSLGRVSLSIIVLIGSLAGATAVGITVADTAPASDAERIDPTTGAATDGEIDRALQDATGDVEVIVRFEPVDQATVQASEDAVETLKTKASTTQGPLQRYAARTEGVTVQQDFWLANAALVTVDTDRVSLEAIASIDGVERIHENHEVTAPSTTAVRAPTDRSTAISAVNRSTTTATSATWGLDKIGAPDVWTEYGTRGDGVRVAVLDTGLDTDHQDLNLYTDDSTDPTYPGGWAEFDRSGNEVAGSEPFDCGSHGTHTSGTVAGGDASGEHIGVAPDVELLHGGVLVENDGGGCYGKESQIIGGMEWAVEQGADVISMSLGGDRYSDGYADAVQNAEDAGVLVVASAGNSGEGDSSTPGNGYDSFAIGASNENDGIERFSSGERVYKSQFGSPPGHWPSEWIVPDVAAPGDSVKSSVPGDGYGWYQGTSMAAPHVAGAAALMEAATTRDLSPAELKAALEDSAWKPDSWSESDAQDSIDGKDTRYGLGIIDARVAVGEVADGTISGRVVDNASGVGIDNATVTAENGSTIFETTTATDGSFELRVEPESTYTLTVERAGYENAATQGVSVGSGETVTYSPSLHGDANITLSVAERHFDDPVETATVTATNETTGTYDAVAAPGDGAYLIENVSSASEYELVVTAAGYEFNATTVTDLSSGTTTAAGERLLVGNATVTGRLTDAYGETAAGVPLPIENASIEVTRSGATSSLTVENATDADGAYAVAVPGIDASYTVTATATYYEATSLTTEALVDGASTTADLRAVGNATLSGTVTTTGVQTENATITATTDASGWDGAAWGNETADGTVSVAVPGNGGNYTVNATSRAFSTDSTTVDGVTADDSFGTLSIHQLARYFGVDDLSAPETVEEGDTVTVEATIVNLGTDDGNETATFRADGTAAGSRNVSLNGTDNASGTGETWTSVSVSFTHTPDSPSSVSYAIATDNEIPTARTAVEESGGSGGGAGGGFAPPASPYFIVGDSTFSPTEVEVGEPVRIETTVKNTGNAPGETSVLFTVDNRLRLGEVAVTVDAKSSTTATLEHVFDEPGEYELAADGEPFGTITVVEPPADAEEAADDETDDEADGDEAGTGDDDGLPGFGVTAAVVALVSVALAAHRRE